MGTFSHHLAACLLHTPIQAGLHGQESLSPVAGSPDTGVDPASHQRTVLSSLLHQWLLRPVEGWPQQFQAAHQETRTFQRTMETLWPLIMEEGSQASQSGAVRTDAGRRSRGRGEAGLPGPWRTSIDQVRSPTTLPWPVLPSG